MKRNLYLNIQEKETALNGYLQALAHIRPSKEQVPVTESLGRITAEAVYARYSSPSYNACAMDGIAVISSHTKNASEAYPVVLREREDYVEVDTGDMLLPPYDAVIMAEELIEIDAGYKILAPTHPFAHVRAVGEDVVAGEMVLPSCHTVRAIDIPVLLSAGVTALPVMKKPVLGIIPTGDEMIDYDQPPSDGKILETNAWMFMNLAEENHGIGRRFPIVPDDLERLTDVVLKAVEACDMVIVNAGSSAGRDDYTLQAIRQLGTVYTHGVAIKPGKPVILGEVQHKPVIGLPGYPVSAYLTFMEFVVPVMGLFLNRSTKPVTPVQARLSKTVMSGLKYEEYVRVKLGVVDGGLMAAPLERGAGASMSLVRADGFCIIPKNREGIAAHEIVDIRPVRTMEEIADTLVAVGSHDLILDVINDLMLEEGRGQRLSSTHVGSMAGLIALKKRETHLAPSHLLDASDGSYNVNITRQMFAGMPMAIIKGVRRRQGLIVKPGNPLGIHTISDITPDVRYINRQNGAGTRVLFDYMLQQAGIAAVDINGYGHEAKTHMAVAVAVQKDNADVGMGIYSCARALGLDFIDMAFEEYDFVTYADNLKMPAMETFMRLLGSQNFRERLDALGGYSFEETGKIIYL